MDNQLQTSSSRPIDISFSVRNVLVTTDGDNVVSYDKEETRELRDFLNQLDLDK